MQARGMISFLRTKAHRSGRLATFGRPIRHRSSRSIGAAILLLLLGSCSSSRDPANTDWDLLGNNAEMQHHSELTQINKDTVQKLGLAWSVDMPSRNGLVGNPLIKDGVIYQGGPEGNIFANDLKTGKLIWHFSDEPADLTNASFAGYWGRTVNRGIALWKDRVIIASNCRLVAVSQKTGKLIWESKSCDSSEMYALTMAPRVGKRLLYVGNSCAESGLSRGYVDAFDAETGKHRWRFYTVPDDPSKPQASALYEMASRTWGDGWYSKLKGCGSVWDGITYDEKLDQLYIGVGGPTPLDPTKRGANAGDELFTNSIVALDAETGEYKWHFKEVPNDAWNYEAAMGVMVADLPVDGKPRRVVVNVPKNGFAYVFDARTGKFISGTQYTKVTWTKGLDGNGRPIPNPEAMYWLHPDEANITLPNPAGSHGWEALAYDPASHLVYIPTMVLPTRMLIDRKYLGGNLRVDPYYGLAGDPKWPAYGELVAWDPVKKSVAWRSRSANPINGGLLHTAGGLVFQGMMDGHLAAFDAASGKKLWNWQTGGAIRAAPSTVTLAGVQYLVVATGDGTAATTANYFARFNDTPAARTPARLLAFRIGGTAVSPPLPKRTPVARPPAPRMAAALAERGQAYFEAYGCMDCHGHGADALGTQVPSLVRQPPADMAILKSIVQQGALAPNGMPRFKDIKDGELEAIYAYILDRAWDGYERDSKARSGAARPN